MEKSVAFKVDQKIDASKKTKRWQWASRFFAAMALMGATAMPAVAELLEYSYTGASGERATRKASDIYSNAVGRIEFALSAGLDRRLRISILDSTGQVVSTNMSHLLGGADRITVAGKEYYGAFLSLPAPGEGEYIFRSEILSSSGVAVRTDDYRAVIDTTPPSASPLVAENSGYGSVNSGNIWKLGIGGSPSYYMHANNVTDSSPIKDTVLKLWREDGSLHREVKAAFDAPTGRASVRYDSGFFPSTNLDEEFEVQMFITDQAGNTWESQKQAVYFDNIANPPSQPFGIYDPDSTSSLGEGMDGFVPYTPGMEVKTNPIRLVYQIPKSNWRTYSPGGLTLVNSLGENKVAHVDNEHVYVIASAPYGNTNGNFIRWVNFGQWGGRLNKL